MADNYCISVAIDIWDGEDQENRTSTGATFIIENDRPLSEVLDELHDLIADEAEDAFNRYEVQTGSSPQPNFIIWQPHILSVERC